MRARLDRRDSRHPQRVAKLGSTQELRQERRLEHGPVMEVQQLHPRNQRLAPAHIPAKHRASRHEHGSHTGDSLM